MFLTAPECILKSSSFASCLRPLLPSFISFSFKLFQRPPNFHPIRFSRVFLNCFCSRFPMWHSAYDDLCPPLRVPRPPPISYILLPPGPARAGSSFNILTNLLHHPASLESHLRVSPGHTSAWTRRLWALK
jgi:hypothetical protein